MRPNAGGQQTSSFTEVLAAYSPGLLPGRAPGQAVRDLPHGTTIVAATYDQGVVLAGDRRATAGSFIAKRDLEKVFRSDEFSALGYAGTGSLGIEFARLFGVELEHYEKMEGRSLSLQGKANRLASMVRGNLPAAMQGLIVVPLFVGYDEDTGQGRIFPVIATVTGDGYRKLSEAEAEDVGGQVVRERMAQPDGPPAQLR